jgi:hypothetical protein
LSLAGERKVTLPLCERLPSQASTLNWRLRLLPKICGVCG